jgi:hypothetical protein
MPPNIIPPSPHLPPPSDQPLSSTSSLSRVWVTLGFERKKKIFSIKCDRVTTTIDDLKKLVKQECTPLLDEVVFFDLKVKGKDGSALRNSLLLSSFSEGQTDENTFIVQVPKKGQ